MIIPSLLTSNKRIAQERITQAQNMSGWLHVDLLDHSLYLYESLPLEELRSLDFGDLLLEAHCMTETPESVFDSVLPIERIIMHIEMKDWLRRYESFIDKDKEVWLAIDPGTSLDSLNLPTDLSGVLMMGVEPGQTGQTLLPDTLERVEQFKDRYPDVFVTVDGGVNAENIRLLIAHGADNLIMGNAIFGQANPLEAYERYVRLSDPLGGQL